MSEMSQRKGRAKAATMAETKVQIQGTKDTRQRAEGRGQTRERRETEGAETEIRRGIAIGH